MAEEEVPVPVAAAKGEHNVSIVLSYMDDEHEKAAIEVGPYAIYPRRPCCISSSFASPPPKNLAGNAQKMLPNNGGKS
jgi:hypothetical protein